MTKFLYVKTQNGDKYLCPHILDKRWALYDAPLLFGNAQAAFTAYEEFRTQVKMSGMESPLMEIKEVEL